MLGEPGCYRATVHVVSALRQLRMSQQYLTVNECQRKTTSMLFVALLTWRAFFTLGNCQLFLCEMLFGPWVLVIDTTLTTRDVPGHEIWIPARLVEVLSNVHESLMTKTCVTQVLIFIDFNLESRKLLWAPATGELSDYVMLMSLSFNCAWRLQEKSFVVIMLFMLFRKMLKSQNSSKRP